jgi:hypothetical protein
MVKQVAILTGAAILGNWLAERFILKDGPDDTSGFVEVKPGLGMDDVARGLTIAAVVMLANKYLPKGG